MSTIISVNADSLPELPTGLQVQNYNQLYAPFGFKIVTIDNKPWWTLATEEDFREAESLRLGISKAVVVLSGCYNTGPTTCGGMCDGVNPTPGAHYCAPMYNPTNQHYYCACT